MRLDNQYGHTHSHRLNIGLVYFMDEEIEAQRVLSNLPRHTAAELGI